MEDATRPWAARVSIEATRYLVEEIGIHCIGTDATGLEVRGRDDEPVHETLFTNDVAVVELLTNLDKLRWSLYSSGACCGTVS